MDLAELVERACHYRALAARLNDGQTREGLCDLAERYEAFAQEAEKETQGHPDDIAA